MRRSPPEVDLVVTEGTDRISRDLGDADRFYKHVEFAGVRLMCVNDGIDSAKRGARMMFGMRAVMADFYLDDLREKTIRGLEGQALRGRSTGGLPLGYSSRPIWGDKREPDGYEIVIDEEAAKLVVRIFELYRAGNAPAAIATTLNAEGLRPPRQRKDRRPGWVASTIREVLRNESYIGRWTYKRKQFRKLPGTNKRRARRRPADQVMHAERPHLRIIDQKLWEEVAERRRSVGAKHTGVRRDGTPGKRAAYPFSGLLFCSECGAPMVVLGGTSALYYRCSDATKRGTCKNKFGVREDAIMSAAVAELKRVVHGELLDLLQQRVKKRLAKLALRQRDDEVRLQKELRRVEAETGRLVDFIRSTDAGPTVLAPVKAALEKLTTEGETLRRQLASLQSDVTPVKLPTAEEIIQGVLNIEACIRSDPVTAREALRRVLLDGKIVMEPQPNGDYRGRSAVLPMQLARTRKPRNLSGAGASGSGTDESVSKVGCAGRI